MSQKGSLNLQAITKGAIVAPRKDGGVAAFREFLKSWRNANVLQFRDALMAQLSLENAKRHCTTGNVQPKLRPVRKQRRNSNQFANTSEGAELKAKFCFVGRAQTNHFPKLFRILAFLCQGGGPVVSKWPALRALTQQMEPFSFENAGSVHKRTRSQSSWSVGGLTWLPSKLCWASTGHSFSSAMANGRGSMPI